MENIDHYAQRMRMEAEDAFVHKKREKTNRELLEDVISNPRISKKILAMFQFVEKKHTPSAIKKDKRKFESGLQR